MNDLLKRIIENIEYDDGQKLKVLDIEVVNIGNIISTEAPALLIDADNNVIDEVTVYTEFTYKNGKLCIC